MGELNDLEFLRKLAAMKVLIVDDQKNMVKTIENMLVSICAFKRKSSSVFRAYDGDQALSLIMNQPDALSGHIDLVLLDWNMPKVPGIEVVRAIRNSPKPFIKDLPVIMITGESLARDVNNALYEGVDNYLLKPFVADDMRTRMNPLLRHYWGGQKMRRAKNRRHENRYFADRVKMKVLVEFMNGEERTAVPITISRHGARVEMDTPKKFEVHGLRFETWGKPGAFENRVDCVGFVPDLEGNPPRIGLSLWFKFGFPDGELEKRWSAWVEGARRAELEYRGVLV